jgi:CRISPR/Cas system endoribonuclease Cas6 (RAMP superfamily)
MDFIGFSILCFIFFVVAFRTLYDIYLENKLFKKQLEDMNKRIEKDTEEFYTRLRNNLKKQIDEHNAKKDRNESESN